MKQLLTFCLSIAIITATAQTKLIAFKSHSGNMSNFKMSLENKLFDDEGSNFGGPAFKSVRFLDSVIYISDTKAVLVTRLYFWQYGQPEDSASSLQVYADTTNNPLFTKKHSLDNIKKILSLSRDYANPVKQVVFIGYDNKKTVKKDKSASPAGSGSKRNSILPVVISDTPAPGNTLFNRQMLQALALIFVLALIGGWLSWKLAGIKKHQPEPAALLAS